MYETSNSSVAASDQIDQLARDLKEDARVLFWGAMGVGKSTLALALAHWFGRHQGTGRILSLDPGSPAYGVPGALNRGRWSGDAFRWDGCCALCTLDAVRFRLPLVQAAGQLLTDAAQSDPSGPMVIDPPGVVRGVAGAELIASFVRLFQVDTVVVLAREGQGLPLAGELAWLPVKVVQLPASSVAVRPSKKERAVHRTRLWESYLGGDARESISLANVIVLGTPPPRHLPDAWIGRQVALLDSRGHTLGMGEVAGLSDAVLTLRVAPDHRAKPAGILVRDAGRTSRGYLETIPHVIVQRSKRSMAAQSATAGTASDFGSKPIVSQVGPALAALVNGVFGDPLVHVRLRNQKRSLLFDLGDPARLAARTAHQVSVVCLSHAHMDHIAGFLWLLRSRIGDFGPCRIFGPANTISRIEHFIGAITWDRIEDNAPSFEVCEFDGHRLKRARLTPGSPKVALSTLPVDDGVLLTEDDLDIKAVVCDHGIPSLAYALIFHTEVSVRKDRLAACGLVPGAWIGRLKRCIAARTLSMKIDLPDGTRRSAGELADELTIIRPGKKMVYAADMADTPGNRNNVVALADTAHTLFCESAFTMAHQDKARATQHLTTLAAVEIARQAHVQRLVPFHFSKRYENDPGAVYEEIIEAAGPVKIIGPLRF